MSFNKLYIIGNGFDLHHGIKSKYSDFEKWLSKFNPELYNKIDEVYGCCDADWWSDFENQLASLDTILYSSGKAIEYKPDLLSDHCDRMWDEAQMAVEDELHGLYMDLRNCFHDWIIQLNPPLESKRIKLERDNSFFLNFNYTRTLEDMYHINPTQILHIHGCVDIDEEFILGHGKTFEELRYINQSEIPEPPEGLSDEELSNFFEYEAKNTELHEQLAEEAALRGVASQQKPVQQLIEANQQFFNSLVNLEEVYVYGMSLSEVDAPYLNLIAVKAPQAHWRFNDYNNYNKQKIEDFCIKNELQNYSIINLNQIIDNHGQLELKFS